MKANSLSSMSNNLFGKNYDDLDRDTNDDVGDDGKNENGDYGDANWQFGKIYNDDDCDNNDDDDDDNVGWMQISMFKIMMLLQAIVITVSTSHHDHQHCCHL